MAVQCRLPRSTHKIELKDIWFIGFIELFIVKVIVAMVSITIMFPVYLVGWTLYSYSVFDKMVNSTLYPDYVDKGIYRIK